MKIMFASSEVVPYAKTGGLADVAGALPKALSKLGHEVCIVMPAYKNIKTGKKLRGFSLSINGTAHEGCIRQTTIPDSKVTLYLIENSNYYNRDQLYQENGHDYRDNAERFSFYSMAALELSKLLSWPPDIIHCNDWQTALIPTYLKTIYKDDDFFRKTASVFTIHNLAYQGLCPHSKIKAIGLDETFFTPDYLEFYGKVNLMKGGLIFANVINSVSKKYIEEIQTPEFGCGLEGLLNTRKEDTFGILNGLDYNVWDPKTDPDLVSNYSAVKLVNKRPNKEALQKAFQLPVQPATPLIGIVSRLDKQKGFDLIAKSIKNILSLNTQLVLLGTGSPEYEKLFQQLREKYPQQIGVALKFDAALAKKIYAGADMFLMPSRYEPCGLGQLISLKYGTIPIVRSTGGLADTIIDYHQNKRSGNGFSFDNYDAESLLDVIQRALLTYREKTAWTKLMNRGMLADFSWENSAKEYVKLYKKALVRAKASR
ncbi:glycogen synthase GlgA [Candidatus Margulisiibacteriota bacterium]